MHEAVMVWFPVAVSRALVGDGSMLWRVGVAKPDEAFAFPLRRRRR